MTRALTVVAVAVLLGSIVVANVLTSRYGFVPVGFGFTATAGTFAAGFALAARDAVQDLLGTAWMLALIGVGTVLSVVLANPAIAVASGAAFALAELINFAVYTPLRRRARIGGSKWAAAVTTSNLAGAVVDTVVFLAIAFGWAAVAPALAGQLVGKAWATLAYVAAGATYRKARA